VGYEQLVARVAILARRRKALHDWLTIRTHRTGPERPRPSPSTSVVLTVCDVVRRETKNRNRQLLRLKHLVAAAVSAADENDLAELNDFLISESAKITSFEKELYRVEKWAVRTLGYRRPISFLKVAATNGQVH
jgi:hypothetical protein